MTISGDDVIEAKIETVIFVFVFVVVVIVLLSLTTILNKRAKKVPLTVNISKPGKFLREERKDRRGKRRRNWVALEQQSSLVERQHSD